MRRMLGFLVLVACLLQPAWSASATHPLVGKPQVSLKKLDAKQVFKRLYGNRKANIKVSKSVDMDRGQFALPHIAVKHGEEGSFGVALLHPVKPYRTTDGGSRYLVMVEIVGLDDENRMVSCHGCSSDVELFVFKRKNGAYVLVSSSEKNAGFGGAYGTTAVDSGKMRIRPVGRNTMGFLYETGFTNQGVTETDLMLVTLNEDAPIKVLPVTTEGGYAFSNDGMYEEGSPQSYSYNGKYRLIPSDDSLYPVSISYRGQKPDADGKIRPYNRTIIYRYQADKGMFVEQ